MPVFESQYADHYDSLYSGKNYRQECDLIEEAISRYAATKPLTVLDVGCGTGQHSMELAKRGYTVTGVDLSAHMLQRARGNAAALPAGQQPSWLQGDARKFQAEGGPFDVGIMMFAVVGYLTRNQDVLDGLRNIRRHLKSGSLFMCDFWYGPSVLHDRPTDRTRILSLHGRRVVRTTQTTLNIVEHTADVRFMLLSIEGDRIVSEANETHSLRYFFPQEFALLLSQTGYTMQSISAFPSIDAPLTDATWNAFVVARAD